METKKVEKVDEAKEKKELNDKQGKKGKEKKIGDEPNKKQSEIIETIENMTALELAGLVKHLEEKFGVKAATLATAPVAASAVAEGGAPKEEKTAFSVILTAIGEKKIQVIKEVRTITNLGLKESKELVDGAPKPVKENVTKEESEEIKKKLEEAGATVEIK